MGMLRDTMRKAVLQGLRVRQSMDVLREGCLRLSPARSVTDSKGNGL